MTNSTHTHRRKYGTPNDKLMEFVQIPTTGNTQEFGELNRQRSDFITNRITASGTSGSTRIEKIALATLGDSTDFGDLCNLQLMVVVCQSEHTWVVEY